MISFKFESDMFHMRIIKKTFLKLALNSQQDGSFYDIMTNLFDDTANIERTFQMQNTN